MMEAGIRTRISGCLVDRAALASASSGLQPDAKLSQLTIRNLNCWRSASSAVLADPNRPDCPGHRRAHSRFSVTNEIARLHNRFRCQFTMFYNDLAPANWWRRGESNSGSSGANRV